MSVSLPPLLLVLVRHGQTDWNRDGRLMGRVGVELNALGREQAASVASALGVLEVDALFTSPQPRARQTAEPIARELGLPLRVEPGFDEVWLTPDWQGKTLDQLRRDPVGKELERLIEDPTYEGESVEPAARVQARTVSVVERLREAKAGKCVVIVSHGDPLRLVLAHYLGLELARFRSLTVDNGSVSILRFGSKATRLFTLNWKADLGSTFPKL